jgi:hypothetical protein
VTYKVIQWATGYIGKMAIRSVAANPDYELAGCRVFSPEKAGKDAGEIAGIGPLGVRATDRLEDVLATDADCVLVMAAPSMFMPGGSLEQDMEPICALLESGKNVIDVVHVQMIHPPSLPAALRERVERACEKGRSSYMACGMDPGFSGEVLGLATSVLMRKIETVRILEVLNYADYDNPAILFSLRFGMPVDEPAGPALEKKEAAWGPMIRLVGDALGGPIEKIEVTREIVPADRDLTIAAGRIAKGTIGAMRFTLNGYVGGRPRVIVQHITRTAEDQAPEWSRDEGYFIDFEGEPSMKVKLSFGNPMMDPVDATGHHAINLIPLVCDAAPGIRTFLDLPRGVNRRALSLG